MKINNDLRSNKKIAFKNTNVFEKFTAPTGTQSPYHYNATEKVSLKNNSNVDKFNKTSNQKASKSEIIALVISVVAASIPFVFGIASIFKKPSTII